MNRLTRKSDNGTVWFIDREHENGYVEREPCEMNTHHVRLAIAKLAEYEDLEEQGKLPRLPCAVGDTVYVIPSNGNFGINIVNGYEENNRVHEQIVDHIEIRRSGYLLSTCDGMACVTEESYKKAWFTDEKEATVKLKELERYWKEVFQE